MHVSTLVQSDKEEGWRGAMVEMCVAVLKNLKERSLRSRGTRKNWVDPLYSICGLFAL